MSQILSQLPRQVLAQQQRLTPQLIQAMDILQLPAMALESRLSAELDSNPALELAPADEDSPESGVEPGATAIARAESDAATRDGGGVTNASDFERLDNLVREYDFDDDFEVRSSRSRARIEEAGDQKLDAMANAAARTQSLQEHLLAQWAMLDNLDERARLLGARIIEALTDAGRLEVPLEQIGAGMQPPPTQAERSAALARVQLLEPAGVGARSLQECLLLQLEALPGDHDLAMRIVEDHFDDLQKNRLPQIARALGVDVGAVQGAIEELGRLSLNPGSDISSGAAPIVMPDVIVEYDARQDRYDVRLARGNLREVRISPEFREALEGARNDPSAREFIKDKIARANAIIDAVRYRRERLLDVARAVVEAQRDFLDHGEQHLKVLRMSDLAQRFGCDPSTISRTVDEKWMQTPRGIFPLRRFFTGGTENEVGEALGWDSIKARVQEIVDREDKSAPLSDDEIVAALRSAGIDIKRRTVAKYRAQLHIPVARQRRKF
ncbi:MAG: RNA polymerase factor sigma-54 [Phycisphaerales bacterium]|nr:RNA polymerase factor sigma-54 [Phycisphaerales bacterium]